MILVVGLTVLGLSPTGAAAFTLYFTVNDGTNPPTRLFKIDTVTLATEALGPIPGSLVPGLAPSPYPNVLFAADRNHQRLLKIDVSTFPQPGSVENVGNFGRDIRELAYDATTGTLYGFDFNSEELYIINKTTGAAATLVGSIGMRLRAMTFDQLTRTLYGVVSFPEGGGLYTIDPHTAALTPVDTSEPGLDQISGIHVVVGHPMVRIMFAIGRDGAANLYTINPATGVETALTPIVLGGQQKVRDLAALLDNLQAPVPVMGKRGLVLSLLLLMGFALRRLRA